MQQGALSEYFEAAGAKILAPVDVIGSSSSHQHEVGDKGGGALKRVLGNRARKRNNRFVAQYLWVNDDDQLIRVSGRLSWYDTRENQPSRSPEWRLYYQGNEVTNIMSQGDCLFVARRPDNTIWFIVVPSGSVLIDQLAWLFGIPSVTGGRFVGGELDTSVAARLDLAARLILDQLGVEYQECNEADLDAIIDRFGHSFPTTKQFSDLARHTCPDVDARDDPDAALVEWIGWEYRMFRRLESKILMREIRQGWVSDDGNVDVEKFLRDALSIQNRRKARMGLSLEHHLEAVFRAFSIRYSPQVQTETGKKADFIFPGEREYRNSAFPSKYLTMLAAKSSCKERWSQVLSEADRVKEKHLVTLEPSIPESSIDKMRHANVQLVIPNGVRTSYSEHSQESWLQSVEEFVRLVSDRQKHAPFASSLFQDDVSAVPA